MADKVPMEYSSFMGPDSLRAMTHLMKALFKNHTPKNMGFEDTEGSYYEGTVENWGDETLMEARKMLLDKPSLKNILIKNTFDYFFEVKYSGFVNTYDQQNMLCALLRKDVLLSNKTYRLKFEDAELYSVPRSQSSSDPNVMKDNFIMTLTPPKLVEVDNETSVETESSLILTDVTGSETVYFFHLGYETREISGEFVDGVMVTEPIKDSMHGWPMVWMCVNVLRTFPELDIVGNEYGEDHKPFLTIGTCGHDLSYVYPFLELTPGDINLENVIIKIQPTDNSSFIENPDQEESNYETDISSISFLIYPDSDIDVSVAPDETYTITYDDEHAKLRLHKDPSIEWQYKTPSPGDYDYDGTTYVNRTYAYISANAFVSNFNFDVNPIAAIDLHMSGSYEYPTEYLGLNAYAGTHIDVTSDYSENAVSKKNGVVHDLGEFDGLPPYYKYNIDRVLHRAHVEMYSLRDKLNEERPLATDKQTAAIIVDSGVPQVEFEDLMDNVPITIRFDRTDLERRHFIWTEEPLSKYNVLSEINYIDMYHLGNARIFSQRDKKKLIYHGNRRFSLHKLGFDPETEYGRVYIISNDKSSYVNNALSNDKKPARTFARICDIPTNYIQLQGIENLCPTFVMDDDYVRTEHNYMLLDVDDVWNKKLVSHVVHDGNRYFFDRYQISDIETLAETLYPKWHNLVSYIDLNDINNVTFSAELGSTNHYQTDDTFRCYIGGITLNGKITDAEYGEVRSVAFLNEITGEYVERPLFAYSIINSSYFDENVVTFDTFPTSGEGTGLRITVTISQLEFDRCTKTSYGILPETFYFFKDDYGNIIIREYTETDGFVDRDQVTGIIEYKNSYDTIRSDKTTLLDSFLYTHTKNKTNLLGNPEVDPWRFYSDNIYNREPDIPHVYPPSTEDLSDYLNIDGVNTQDAYFVLTESNIGNYCMINRFTNAAVSDNTDIKYPDFADINLPKYYLKSCALKYNFDHIKNDQPIIHVYDPAMDTIKTLDRVGYSVNKITESRPMSFKDIFVKSIYTPKNIINDKGYLEMNVYRYSEYTDNNRREEYRAMLSRKNHEELVNMIRSMNDNAYPLRYEPDSYYKFSDNDLIDYIIENMLYWGPENVAYTDSPPTIYRKPELVLFATRGDRVFDHDTPVGEQPTGGYVELMEEFDPNRVMNEKDVLADPTFIFRLDAEGMDPEVDLVNFRMYDGNVDITFDTLLIVINDPSAVYGGASRYIAKQVGSDIVWINLRRAD